MSNNYKCILNNKFVKDNYTIVPIRYEDRMKIMQWRNEQIYHLRQANPLTETNQESYFKNVVAKLFDQEKPDQILFSYLENGECIGYGGLVHINWIDKNAEISFIINTVLEKNGFHKHWGIYLGLIERVAFEELHLRKIYTYAFDLRPNLYEALEANGYIREAELKEHCYFDGKFISVIIHSKVAADLSLRKATKEDCALFFEWANDDIVRNNSFHTEKIKWESHIVWFNNRLNSEQHKLYVLMNHDYPVGQIRLDKENDYWLIDYSIDKKHRGKGWGRKLIGLLSNIDIHPIKACVKIDNISSVRAFQYNSFAVKEGMMKGEKVYIFYKS